MSAFIQALHSGKVLLMDGAMGTELLRRGLQLNRELAPHWNLSHPEAVAEVHRSYLEAGATCILTNTFTAHLCGDQHAASIVSAAVSLARSCTSPGRFVLGSIGPGAADGLQRMLRMLNPVDALMLETQFSPFILSETLAHLPSASPGTPIVVSFGFAEHDGQYFCPVPENERWCAGRIAQWAEQQRPRLAALGVNCGLNLDLNWMLAIVRGYRRESSLPILMRPNTGPIPSLAGDATPALTPAQLAARVPELVDAGVTLLGGCCGTTPDHIAAMGEVLDQMGVLWKP